jgi:hypothetical protein
VTVAFRLVSPRVCRLTVYAKPSVGSRRKLA